MSDPAPRIRKTFSRKRNTYHSGESAGGYPVTKAHTLTDNFDDNSIDTSKWGFYGPVQEVNQRLEFRPEGNPAGYAGCKSLVPYDLTDSFLQVEVSQVLRASVPSAQTSLFARGSGTDKLVFIASSGMLTCFQSTAGKPDTQFASVPYDPERHLKTSPDAASGATTTSEAA